MADLNLALTGVSAAGAVGTTIPDGSGDVGIALSGVAGAGALGSVAYGEVYALTGVRGTGTVGRVFYNESVGGEGLGLAFPTLQLAITGVTGAIGDLELNWPAPTLAIAGTTSLFGTVAWSWPAPALEITGVTGTTGALDLRFPSPVFSFGSGNSLNLEMPRLQLTMTGTTGAVGSLSMHLPRWTFTTEGVAHAAGALVFNFPVLQMAIAGDTGRAARLAMRMKALQLALTGTTGVIGSLALELPIFQLDIVGAQEASGSLVLTVPAFRLQLSGGTVLAAGESEANATTLVMQTERGALTHYTNYPFNSFAAFNGVYLGACDDGVFALTGADDAGVAIAAAARGGTTDFGTSHLKRIERIYVGYRSTGRMILRVITEERWTRDYALVPDGHAGLHGARVKLGRGLEARYWQFELQNDAGCDFDVDMMEMKPIKLKRRVGGGNA